MNVINPIVRAAIRVAQEAVYATPTEHDGTVMVFVPRVQLDNLRKQIELDIPKQVTWPRGAKIVSE